MHNALDISTSALVAQRMRMNVIAGNLANMSSQRNEDGDIAAYQERFSVFQADESVGGGDAAGVKLGSIETETVEPLYRYQPDHPLAIQNGPRTGYVAYPNINMTEQMVDAMQATRAYQANVGVIEITKEMATQALRILG